MGRDARLGLLLLGLLAVFGAIHAPLHGDEAPCSPLAPCAGGLTLLATVAIALVLCGDSSWRIPRPLAARARRHPAFLVERGRAPPRD